MLLKEVAWGSHLYAEKIKLLSISFINQIRTGIPYLQQRIVSVYTKSFSKVIFVKQVDL